jgi:transcriptional regulator GlxA family with amidase domain
MRVQIIIFDGFDEMDGVAPYEVFQFAAAKVKDLIVQLVTVHDLLPVKGQHGLIITPQAKFDASARDSLVIVTGGGWLRPDTEPGVKKEIASGAIPEALRNSAAAGATITSVCTGAMLLAAAGLTKGRRAVTHWLAIDDLAKTGACITYARVVDDGNIVTAGGVTSGLDLALWLVERFYGAPISQWVASIMEHGRRAPIAIPGFPPVP